MKHYVVTKINTFRFEANSMSAAKKKFANLEEGSDFDFETESFITEEETGKEDRNIC